MSGRRPSVSPRGTERRRSAPRRRPGILRRAPRRPWRGRAGARARDGSRNPRSTRRPPRGSRARAESSRRSCGPGRSSLARGPRSWAKRRCPGAGSTSGWTHSPRRRWRKNCPRRPLPRRPSAPRNSRRNAASPRRAATSLAPPGCTSSGTRPFRACRPAGRGRRSMRPAKERSRALRYGYASSCVNLLETIQGGQSRRPKSIGLYPAGARMEMPSPLGDSKLAEDGAEST